MSINKLKEILDAIDYPVLMEIVDCSWCRDHTNYYFSWNDEDNPEDLENEDGNTYSMEAFEGCFEYGGYLVVNGNNGCGQTITYFFNLDKEVKF
jgi:hypothetical protein